jgi:hypothetical protein
MVTGLEGACPALPTSVRAHLSADGRAHLQGLRVRGSTIAPVEQRYPRGGMQAARTVAPPDERRHCLWRRWRTRWTTTKSPTTHHTR